MDSRNALAALPAWLAPAMALSGVGLLALAAAALWLFGDNGESITPAATPTSRPTETETPAATATPEDPLGAVPVTVGDDVPFPENTSLVVARTPYGKSWGVIRVERWTRATGAVVRETLFEPPGPNSHISGVAADGPILFAGVVAGECAACLPYGDPAGRTTTIYWSDDGGVTWTEGEELDGVWIPRLVDRGNVLLVNYHGERIAYARLGSGGLEPVLAPPSANLDELPIALDGAAAWQHESSAALIDEGGTVFKPDFYDPLTYRMRGVLRTREATVITWEGPGDDPEHPARYVIEGTMGGGRSFVALQAYRFERLPRLAGTLGDRIVVTSEWSGPGDLDEGAAPALIDLASRTLNLIAETKDRLTGVEVLLAMEGPFLRVDTPGDCLNIRTTAGGDAPVIGCAADGVLLVDREDTWDRDGVTWLAVRTSSGESGWASAEFLAR